MNLVSGLIVRRTSGHHVEEFREFDLSAAVLIEFCDHLIDCLGLGLDSERIDSDFEF